MAIIDGADADSGTSWEMGYAHALGKKVIALRTDFRHVGHHEHVNLMLEQSSTVVTSREDLMRELLPFSIWLNTFDNNRSGFEAVLTALTFFP